MASEFRQMRFPSTSSPAERFAILRHSDHAFLYKDFRWTLMKENGVFVFKLGILFEQEGYGEFRALSRFEAGTDFHTSELYRRLERYEGSGESLRRDTESLYARALDRLVFLLGMAEVPSYWKACASSRLLIRAGHLTEEECAWWLDLYWNGLGEYLYLNELPISRDRLMDIQVEAKQAPLPAASADPYTRRETALIAVGGGKDSVVTLERMRPEGTRRTAFCINPNQASLDCLRIADIPPERCRIWSRRIDPALLELNARGFLNGHTPFSSVLAFYAYVTAWLCGDHRIVLSNEASANEATIPGTQINHQYSKSAEFEKAFRRYSGDFPGKIEYFSLLRPFSELQIARDFSEHPEYFSTFRSCNLGSRGGRNLWCGHCAKCLFVYILLSPWIETAKLNALIGRNLWAAEDLTETFDELTGYRPNKPFECVGTPEETRLAAVLCFLRFYAAERTEDLPFLLRRFVTQVQAGAVPDVRRSETVRGCRLLYSGPDLLNERYPHDVPEAFLPYLRTRSGQEPLSSLLLRS